MKFRYLLLVATNLICMASYGASYVASSGLKDESVQKVGVVPGTLPFGFWVDVKKVNLTPEGVKPEILKFLGTHYRFSCAGGLFNYVLKSEDIKDIRLDSPTMDGLYPVAYLEFSSSDFRFPRVRAGDIYSAETADTCARGISVEDKEKLLRNVNTIQAAEGLLPLDESDFKFVPDPSNASRLQVTILQSGVEKKGTHPLPI